MEKNRTTHIAIIGISNLTEVTAQALVPHYAHIKIFERDLSLATHLSEAMRYFSIDVWSNLYQFQPDVCIVCAETPIVHNETLFQKYDNAIAALRAYLTVATKEVLIIVRSIVPPRTTEKLYETFGSTPHHYRIVYSPVMFDETGRREESHAATFAFAGSTDSEALEAYRKFMLPTGRMPARVETFVEAEMYLQVCALHDAHTKQFFVTLRQLFPEYNLQQLLYWVARTSNGSQNPNWGVVGNEAINIQQVLLFLSWLQRQGKNTDAFRMLAEVK